MCASLPPIGKLHIGSAEATNRIPWNGRDFVFLSRAPQHAEIGFACWRTASSCSLHKPMVTEEVQKSSSIQGLDTQFSVSGFILCMKGLHKAKYVDNFRLFQTNTKLAALHTFGILTVCCMMCNGLNKLCKTKQNPTDTLREQKHSIN